MKAATPIPSESIRALSPFVPAQAGTQVNACGICGAGSPLARGRAQLGNRYRVTSSSGNGVGCQRCRFLGS
jgi:hypothetical protein